MATDLSWLDSLNSEQRRAATHASSDDGLPPPLLIIAGAGSGKTTTLAHRVAHLIASGADPSKILLLTFSRRAAAEMTNRVERIAQRAFGGRTPGGARSLTWAGTFHAVGARLLREYAEQIALAPAFTILDREDAADVMNLARHELGLSEATGKRFPGKNTCLAIYSRTVNAQEPLDAVLRKAFPWCAAAEDRLRELFAAYVETKQAQAVLDYDDLLLYWAQMMAEPVLAAEIGGRFDHVLVDEYQDTNALQSAVLLAMKPDGRGVTVVGDDAQSIYSFRAATVRNILDFPNAFSPKAAIVTLERNYRSTEAILGAANAVIGLALERFTKKLWSDRHSSDLPRLVTVRDEADQARYVADTLLENRETGMELKSQAVLFRASHHSAPLELELTRRSIPFVKFGGLKFLEAAHVKDILAVLRWAENPRDRIAGFRLLQLLPGLGPKTAGGILDLLTGSADAVAALVALPAPARSAEAWRPFVALMELLSGAGTGWPSDLNAARAWYQPHLERIYDDAPIRLGDLIQLEQIAQGYPSRERFLTDLTLDPPEATSDEAGPPHRDEDYVILSTIHSAKGQEWKAVFVLNGVDGCIPSDLGTGTAEDLEEERRLLYVAMTRARDQLSIILPQRFYVTQQRERGDKHLYASRTRFIPADILPLFEAFFWPPVKSASIAAQPSRVRIDIGARMRTMWR